MRIKLYEHEGDLVTIVEFPIGEKSKTVRVSKDLIDHTAAYTISKKELKKVEIVPTFKTIKAEETASEESVLRYIMKVWKNKKNWKDLIIEE